MWRLSALVIFKLVTMSAVIVTAGFSIGLPIHDPWFDVWIVWYFFSALTSGMPEPDDNSGFGYVWMFRSFHIISANGTAYFINKSKWHDISGEPPKE